MEVEIYKTGQGYLIKDGRLIKDNAFTDYDLSDKSIGPTGDFVYSGEVTSDFVTLTACIVGTKKQTLCKYLPMQTKQAHPGVD